MNTGKIPHYDFIRYKAGNNPSDESESKNACEHAELIGMVFN